MSRAASPRRATAAVCLAAVAVAVLAAATVDGVTIFESPPGLPNEDLYKAGDVNLGGLVRLYYPSPDGQCSKALARVGVQVAQAMLWAIGNVNNNSQLLPNITLGYAILNDCGREGVALARAVKFLPPSPCLVAGCGGAGRADSGVKPFYRVAGVMGPYSSSLSVAVSSVLSLYRVPHISWSATSQELSDKARFQYFSRAVPPDQYQAAAIVNILQYYNWTYISTLHSEGSYGVNGIRNVQRLAKKAGICIAYSRELKPDDTEADYDNVIVQLRKNFKAKVVIAFTVGYSGEGLFRAIRRASATEFIYIGSDGFQPTLEFKNAIVGLNALVLNVKSSMDEDFKRYYTKELTPWRGVGQAVKSPWYGEYSPADVGCDWSAPPGHNSSCSKYKVLTDFPQFFLFPGIARVIDIVKTYAHGLHNLIFALCPEAVTRKDLIASCITGPRSLQYIREASFQGSSGYVSYDKSGDLLGDYFITQVRGIGKDYSSVRVGSWSRSTQELVLNEAVIVWPQVDIMNPTEEGDRMVNYGVPESVCAKPCFSGEFYIQGELVCCWECRKCRSNERLREDVQGCVTCPDLYWPDQENFTTCESIPPTYMLWPDPIALGLVGLATAGLLSVFSLTYIFVKYSDKKVIKGSSRELMAPIKAGLLLAYVTVVAYISKPEDWTCYANYCGFNLACTFIFGPLFLKTNRLYRIFAAAERCEQGVRFVDGKSQVIFFVIMVVIQVGLTTVAAMLLPPAAILKMPIPTERFVELLCTLPLQNLLIPLCYNILLLLLCAIFGFLTRKLPDNFNESWYIFISVTTTLFVWIAFLPTYFVAFFAYHKAALLALALILNGVVTTLCLFVPKIYALYYVDEKMIKVTNWSQFDGPTEGQTQVTTTGTAVR